VIYTFEPMDGGEAFELNMPVAEYGELVAAGDEDEHGNPIVTVELDGETIRARRNMVVDARRNVGSRAGDAWPQVSKAMANPGMTDAEVRSEQEYLDKAGVPTQYTKDREPIFESRGHWKRYMQAMGYHDRDAGYGDQSA